MPGVLEGIRVLDFGRYIAGPFCGTMLGDLGAEVIRIEKLEGSEDRWVTPVTEDGQGAMFLQMGRNKLGLTLNPMKPAGREIVKKLVAVSDVVIANLPYEDLKKMGIDYDTISAINPRIILATNSTFGSEGPYATRVGFDTIGQAMSGAMHLSGDGKVPTRANAPYVDFGSALLSTVGVMAALMDRAKSGKGQKVETALLRTAINITNSHLIEQAMLGLDRIATLNRGFTAGPSDTFKCKDGWIYAMTIGQPLFVRWCRLMGNEDLTADPRFKDDLAPRRQRRGAVGDHAEVVRRPHRRRGARAAGSQPHPGRRGLHAAADARRQARQRGGLLPFDGVSGRGQADPGAAGAGEALAHAAHHPLARAEARRAYRRDPGRAGLRARGDREAARRTRGMSPADRFAPCPACWLPTPTCSAAAAG